MPTKRGWMPLDGGPLRVVHKPTNKYWPGRPHGIDAAVIHICDGSYAGSVGWLWNAITNPSSSAHFVLDPLSGEITQLVSIYDSAWANGLKWDAARQLWIDPEGAR